MTDSSGPTAAKAAARPAAPTATSNNLTEAPTPSRSALNSLDDDTTPTPTRTVTTTVNMTDPPPPLPGAVPVSVVPESHHEPPAPQPGAVPRFPIETSAAAAAATSIPAPSFTLPPPIQSTYAPPTSSTRGQPTAGSTATDQSTMFHSYHAQGQIRPIAPMPGNYQQSGGVQERYATNAGWQNDTGVQGQSGGPADDSILGKMSKAIDQFNEWMVGGPKDDK
ncbi:hypothetical protein ABW21_db0203391 [Orbilia brochopaga]|nr:hypothetical protein ABW21_db0203391 [Drechslerella brochopaga]